MYRRRLKEREKAIVQVKRRRGREELDRKAEIILSDYFREAPQLESEISMRFDNRLRI